MIEEYKALRNEMLNKIELHNKLIMFTITTTVAILAYAFSQKSCYIFLLPYCIIIPVSVRVLYYRRAMVKITAYIIVFIETNSKELNWETRNHQINSPYNKKISSKLINININYDCFILTIACYILFILNLNKDFSNITNILIFIFWSTFPLFFIIIELIISVKCNQLYKVKQYWINEWKKLETAESVLK